MLENLMLFVLHWGIMSLSLWVASYVFSGIRFANGSTLVVSALLLGFANAIIRPLLIVLTLPLTIATLGIFLLVINTLMLMLVSALVKGFTVSGFWTAFFASTFIALLNLLIWLLLAGGNTPPLLPTTGHGVWL